MAPGVMDDFFLIQFSLIKGAQFSRAFGAE